MTEGKGSTEGLPVKYTDPLSGALWIGNQDGKQIILGRHLGICFSISSKSVHFCSFFKVKGKEKFTFFSGSDFIQSEDAIIFHFLLMFPDVLARGKE